MNISEIKLIGNISLISVIIPLVFSVLAMLKRKQPAYVRLAGVLIFAGALSDVICKILVGLNINQNPQANVFVIGQFMLICHIYATAYSFYRKIDVYIIPAFAFYTIYNLLYRQEIIEFNSNLVTASALVFIPYTIIFYRWLYKNLPYPRIERSFMFWFTSGVFIYFSCSVFTFISLHSFIDLKDNNQLFLVWAIHNVSNIVKNLVLAVAFYMTLRFEDVILVEKFKAHW